MAFTGKQPIYEVKNATAEVDTENGILVFTECKPVKEYQYLGEVKIKGIVSSLKYDLMVDKLTKKAKKEYPTANAIIYHTSKQLDVADAIIIK